MEYSTDLFEAATIVRLAEHFTTLLTAVTTTPDHRVNALPLVSPTERRQLVEEWNATAVPLPPGTVHEMVSAQAARTPHAIAVVGPAGEEVTYAELETRANALAHYLRAQGVGPEVRVALCVERSVELVVALLGILKAGGAYVPLDPSYPAARLAFMLADSDAALLLTQTPLPVPAAYAGPVVWLDAPTVRATLATQPVTAPAPDVRPGEPRVRHLHLRLHRHPKG